MEISYKTKKLEKKLTNPKELSVAYGAMSKNIMKRIIQLEVAEILEDIRKITSAKCHELSGDLKGKLSVTITGNWRLIFIPNNDPLYFKEDGGLDWSKITKIKIIDLIDYH